MPKRTKIDGPATLSEVEEAKKAHSQPYQQIRLIAVRMALKGFYHSE